jgi:glycosyltransferase involved in cell wall biosynthesis
MAAANPLPAWRSAKPSVNDVAHQCYANNNGWFQTMKTAILIAYGFPPDGSAGVYRPLRFIRHLPAMGWSASVIAADLAPYGWSRYDPGLLALVPSETEVIRVGSRDLWQAIQERRAHHTQEKLSSGCVETTEQIRATHNAPARSFLREIVRTVEAWCYHPDMARGWISPALEATIRVCSSRKPHVILATGGPWSSFIVAERASQRMGVPYVLDFRDSWTLSEDPFEARRPAWATRLNRRTLHRLFERAHAVIFRYETEAECYWRAYQAALDVAKIHLIPNGYDGMIDEFAAPGGDKCTILYAGTLPPYRYDTLLQALHSFKKSEPTRAQQLRFLFVGDGMEVLAKDAAALGLSDIIETRGVVSYAEVTRLQKCAHALLLLGLKPVRGYEFCGSKVFSYLQAGRPIIGVLPWDETKKVLQRVGVSTIADIDSLSGIVVVLRQLLDAWETGMLTSLVPNRAACEVYSAQRQTAALVRALEGTPAVEPFVPGVVEIPPSLQSEIGERGWVSGVRRPRHRK